MLNKKQMTSALPPGQLTLAMNSNPYILLDGISRKKIFKSPPFLFFRIVNYDFIVHAYFTNAATSSTLIDNVTKLSCIEYLIQTY